MNNCTQNIHDQVASVILHALDGETLPPEKLHNLINAVTGLVEKEKKVHSFEFLTIEPDWTKEELITINYAKEKDN